MAARQYSCGDLIASSCIPFTGKDLSFLDGGDQIACDAFLNDVIEEISDAIDIIQTKSDVSTLTASCITFTSPRTVKSVFQDYGTKICVLNASLTALTTQVNNLDISTELITLNLGSLAAAAAPCLVSANTYTLVSILQLFANEIIAIKTEIGI